MMTFYCYPKCTTCQRAKKWLLAKGIAFEELNLKETAPTADMISAWQETSGLPLKRFFNTSGQSYRALDLAKRLPELTREEQLRLLTSDGMLVKRPILVGDGFVLVGFREEQWQETLS